MIASGFGLGWMLGDLFGAARPPPCWSASSGPWSPGSRWRSSSSSRRSSSGSSPVP
ncbi:hypothetical protein NKG05_03475 [Oerskovia sp. M15]